MVKALSVSYPYLAVAQAYDVPYAQVLFYAEMFELSVQGSIVVQGDAPGWVRATWAAFNREMQRRAAA